jgi:tetratricopeptide (TPR) repeat protein
MADRAYWRGDREETVAIWRRIVERNPLTPTDRFNLANFLFIADKHEESAAEFRKALELNPDFRWNARLAFIAVLITLHRFNEAHAETMKLPEGVPRDHGLALLYQAPGHGRNRTPRSRGWPHCRSSPAASYWPRSTHSAA